MTNTKDLMTKEDAWIIKDWRDSGCTWRTIATRASAIWGRTWDVIPGDQESGRHLCNLASEALGQEVD